MSNTAQSELKPCPFCGAPAEMDTKRAYCALGFNKIGTMVAIYCTSCAADMGWCREDHPDMPLDEMIHHVREDWNRRASQSPTSEEGRVSGADGGVIQKMATELAPEMDRLLDVIGGGGNQHHYDELRRLLWDNKNTILRALQILAASPPPSVNKGADQ